MFKKVLIASRGEIAVRIIRTLKEMGIYSIAVYSQADMSSLPVRLADKAVCIGPASAAKSYLNADAIISAAKITGAEAIHPGYGFLSENADFAEACAESGITFIGPYPETMRQLGDKAAARRLAIKAGIPVTPGTKGCVSPENALEEARKIGFPIMLKAAAGGGGKGIRISYSEADLLHEYQIASSEAMAAFGNGSLYFEKYIQAPRHIEIQFVRDSHGNVMTFPERDCSIQRRHQKLIEETPSPAVSEELRSKLRNAACMLAEQSGYTGAGTVEFLLDKNGNYWFMEVNARLQVEHPVTEAITGHDIVREQILAAAGLSLSGDSLRGNNLKVNQIHVPHYGHAFELRINAENPAENFRPCPGKIKSLSMPGGPGIRIDTHIYAGYSMPVYYDSLMAKIIVCAQDRQAAIARAKRSLAELETEGIQTTSSIFFDILDDEDFKAGKTSTDFVEKMLAGKHKKQ